ncbi:putative gluconolactonase protein [Eutypa lata UCREL1]|uniref:Putative gluconolactonase protein n=1 Tax=Eutypa lata (strain UCR-EL1) TaxID=1287681 RepID=M7SZK6_EUTLA|nr:putative gluconolactonase protein [Eutypa lata UCREL1]
MAAPKQLDTKPLTDGLLFGESPRYRDGLLYISDMTGRAIYTIDASSGEKKVLREVENQPNGMCFAPDGSLIWSSMFDAKLYRRDATGKDTLYADLSNVMTGYCGDMSIDISGRVYLDDTGARVLHGEQPRPGRLLIIETDGSVKVADENIIFPNALFISNDGKTLFCAETFGYGLLKWQIGPDGQLSNRQQVWSPKVISPTGEVGNTAHGLIGIDGGCMDAEDGMWLSMLGLEKFLRLDQQGNITHEIKVHGHATACALGGQDGKTLFMVTNWFPDDEESIFSAMVAKRTKCSVSVAVVDIPKGTARP